jgi:hypothetical protein
LVTNLTVPLPANQDTDASMIMITEPDYKIPIIEALTPHRFFESGANKPLLITGVDSDGKKGDYVVKFKGAGRMSNEACMRELLASFIASQMGIRIVSPVIVNISKHFIDLLIGNEAWEYANKSLDFNYGSDYLEKYMTMLPTQDLNNNQLRYAQTIFAFDLIIQNPDRTNEKPNMITDGTEIVIYDHELAFSFVMDIFPNLKPWEIRQSDLGWINRHCLLPKIKGKEFDFPGFSERFDNLDKDFWDIARNLIPEEWYSDQFQRIKQHFSAICNNKDAFILELKKVLS